jgi:hypothetical protein
MIGHQGQRECARKSDGWGKLSGEEIDCRDGKDSEDQRNNTQISFRFFKWVEKMSENEDSSADL